MMNANQENIEWLDGSTDRNGRLFIYDNNIYRALYGNDKEFYQKFINWASTNYKLQKLLVKTKVSELQLEDADIIVQHELIKHITYPYEWSPLMFKDAARCHCDVHYELAVNGYSLQDAHLWNVTFNNTQPVYIDFGGIIKTDPSGSSHLMEEYLKYMIYPLYLMSRGHGDKSRRYLNHSSPPLQLRDLIGYFNLTTGLNFLKIYRRNKQIPKNGLPEMLNAISGIINELLPKKNVSRWSGYHDDENNRPENGWHNKQINIAAILSELKPNSVLDVGCATGWYSVMTAKKGINVISIDTDEHMIDDIYRAAKDQNLPILPVIKNIFSMETASARFTTDMVFALAIVHHLVFTMGRNFDAIARTLADYSGKWLITEFIGREDPFVKEQLSNDLVRKVTSFYTLENFIKSLGKYFNKIEKFESTSANRTLLLCSK